VLLELDLQAIAELSVHLLYFFFRKFVLSPGYPYLFDLIEIGEYVVWAHLNNI